MKFLTGFTLIELLVVITIIVVLAGLLIPGVLRAMKQAKTNRALSEMQHLATVITQIYSETGYYVPLENLAESNNANVRRWVSADYAINGQDDQIIMDSGNTLSTPAYPDANDVMGMWNGPYVTYKNYYDTMLLNYTGNDLPIPPNVWDITSPISTNLRNAPLDPWGRPYRMFWIDKATAPAAGARLLVPLGANGTMVIISAGGDGLLQSLLPQQQRPTRATRDDFNAFNPNNAAATEKDVYYIF